MSRYHAMKTSLTALALCGVMVASLAGCAGGGVYGETDAVYYGPDYDTGPWFYGGGWVPGRRWDHRHWDRDHREVHPPPHDEHGPHLPRAPRPPTPHHLPAPPRPPAPPHPFNH